MTHNHLRRLRNSNNIFNRVVFIGNGAIENGEKPLQNWMYEFSNNEGKKLIRENRIHFNTWLSAYSIAFRIMRGARPTSDPEFRKLLDKKIRLGNMYEDKRFLLKERSIPTCIKDYINQDDTLIICSNWDTTFLDKEEIQNIIQIHGSCRIPQTMIFPCEFLMDYGKKFKHLAAPDIDLEYIESMQQMHQDAIKAVQNCKEIFIWGLSLNDYDAEIMAILGNAPYDGIEKKLWVINPDKMAAYRASWITNIYQFKHILPSNIESIHDIKI